MKVTLGRVGQVFMILLAVLTAVTAVGFIVIKKTAAEAEKASKWANEKAWDGYEVSSDYVSKGYQEADLNSI